MMVLERVLNVVGWDRDVLTLYQIFLRRQVEKEETAWKESRFISGIFDTITAALQAGYAVFIR